MSAIIYTNSVFEYADICDIEVNGPLSPPFHGIRYQFILHTESTFCFSADSITVSDESWRNYGKQTIICGFPRFGSCVVNITRPSIIKI